MQGVERAALSDADRANAERVDAADLPVADLRDLSVRLAGLPAGAPRVTCTQPIEYQVGDTTHFNVSNLLTFDKKDVLATLIAREPNVYMWVDNNWLSSVDRAGIEEAARIFDQEIIPRNRALFGKEWSPGIDCDPRLYVLHTSGTGVGGYFSSVDEYTTAVRSDSNQKEMFYIDLSGIGGARQIGSDFYLGVLAHEHQHMIHFHVDGNEDAWANEGLADLAAFLNGYDINGHDKIFAQTPDTQLNHWPANPSRGPSYGASFTFWLYLYDKFGENGLLRIVADPHNGLNAVAGMLPQLGYAGTFEDFFGDWVIAKYLDDTSLDDGRYGFSRSNPPQARIEETIRSFPYHASQPIVLPQYSAHYTTFISDHDIQIEFAGQTKTRLLKTQAHSGEYFWWSNRGDSANTRLTREIDLSKVRDATLSYWVWFDIEEGWDYAYVTASEDDGATWTTLRASSSTNSNPNHANFGWGYTGRSGNGFEPAWIEDQIDLAAYAGKKILLRFEMINDLSTHLPGLALDDIRIPEIDFSDDAESDSGWIAEGWVRSNNFVPQTYIAQAIGYGRDGNISVTRLPTEANNTATWELPLSEWNSAVVVIAPMALNTTEQARFNWLVSEK